MESVDTIVLLLFVVTFLAIVSFKYRFPLPILLVLAGLIISIIPGLPSITIQPSIIFLIFLPPLLYQAAWNMSWKEFKANIRPISLASIGLVFFTTACIGILVHFMLPNFSWAHAFLLGAIISPPDAVAAGAITKGLGLHPRIIAILEGESLLNDASALIAFKYALGVILIGSFSLQKASLNFLLVFSGGLAIGLLVGFLIYLLHKKWVKDSSIDVTLTFLTPFTAYLLAEHFHVSGVLAVVSAGLYLSFRSTDIFTHTSRLQSYAVWSTVGFVLNALVFILIGLQLRTIIQNFEKGELPKLVLYGVVISITGLFIRFFWTVPATLLPRALSRKIRETEEFDKRYIFVFSWAGMKGIVSMAAALSVPYYLSENVPFPYRSEIIFLTFVVILFSLLVQGISLPVLIKKLRLPKYSVLAEEFEVRKKLIDSTKTYIEERFKDVDEELRERLLSNYMLRYQMLEQTQLPNRTSGDQNPATLIFNRFGELQLELLKDERKMANVFRKEGKTSEEVLRKIEREIDLEEGRIRLEIYQD